MKTFDISDLHFGKKGKNDPPPMIVHHTMDGVSDSLALASSTVEVWRLDLVKVELNEKPVDVKIRKLGPGLIVTFDHVPNIGAIAKIQY